MPRMIGPRKIRSYGEQFKMMASGSARLAWSVISMEIKATNISAFLAGSFAVCAIWLASKLMPYSNNLSDVVFGIYFFIFIILVFVTPVVLLVVGKNNFRFRYKDIVYAQFYSNLCGGAIRVICWFLGAASCGGLIILAAMVIK